MFFGWKWSDLDLRTKLFMLNVFTPTRVKVYFVVILLEVAALFALGTF